MRTFSFFLFFSTVLIPVSFAAESVRTQPVAPQIIRSQAGRLAASQMQIADQMRALGFNVVDAKNMGGNKWQVKVVGWDPGQAQPTHRNVLKWDPSIRNPSNKNASVRWDPFDRQPAKKGSMKWDPTQKAPAQGNGSSVNWDPTQSNPATVDVEYSAGNIVLSKGSLQSLGIVQGSKNFPQGMQMR